MIVTPVLVINSGSSSLKFSLFDMASDQELLSGQAERLNTGEASLRWRSGQQGDTLSIPDEGHAGALKALYQLLLSLDHLPSTPLSIGHRVVHGGETFSDSVVINENVIRAIEQCSRLAPLHNPANLLGIQVMQKLYPDVPQVAVFDTAFHQTLKPESFLYPLPWSLYEEQGVRRYGFHGTSHRYVSQKAVDRLKLDPDQHGLVCAHLGNGCSAAAVRNGLSVDTTMGMTPLEGLVMGTRSGDVDPGLHEYLSDRLGWSLTEITEMLNRRSGLLGLSGLSNDMRTLVEALDAEHEGARRAIDVFCFRLARQIGALATSLGRLDALVFTGGIGEHSAFIRQNVLDRLGLLGFVCDANLNEQHGGNSGVITTSTSTPALVIATREEWMIARDAQQLTFLPIRDN
ncbi:MAG: acetate kinase [Saccharospirillum sp.]|nr:acetate kinase [Saccharospirillum sp.]